MTQQLVGGDEVNALVLDIGSGTVKAGYAGEDTPKVYFPSWVGATAGAHAADGKHSNGAAQNGSTKRQLHVGQQAVDYRQDHMQMLPALQEGLYSNWDIVEGLWDHVFRDRLRADVSEHPLLLAEPSHQPPGLRERMVETIFEQHRPPALYVARNAMLSSFACGRQTSLVIDAGHAATVGMHYSNVSLCAVAAVHDGFVLRKSVQSNPMGGRLLSQCMQASVQQRGHSIKPRFAFRRVETAPGKWEVKDLDTAQVHPSFRQYHVEQVAADIKEATFRTSDVPFALQDNLNIPTVTYELPDGNELQVGPERFNIPEILFQPGLIAGYREAMPSLPDLAGLGTHSLPDSVRACIEACDVDIRRDMFNGIVLAGGGSLLTQLRERLDKELLEGAPPTVKVKITCPANSIERRFNVWLGGSILASLGSFQQMWMSKAEFEEHGASLIHRKAP